MDAACERRALVGGPNYAIETAPMREAGTVVIRLGDSLRNSRWQSALDAQCKAE